MIEEASGVRGAVTVPATLGGVPVTELETGFLGMSGVFYGCTELTEVRWEEGCAIEKIGGSAFRGCTSLTQCFQGVHKPDPDHDPAFGDGAGVPGLQRVGAGDRHDSGHGEDAGRRGLREVPRPEDGCL